MRADMLRTLMSSLSGNFVLGNVSLNCLRGNHSLLLDGRQAALDTLVVGRMLHRQGQEQAFHLRLTTKSLSTSMRKMTVKQQR